MKLGSDLFVLNDFVLAQSNDGYYLMPIGYFSVRIITRSGVQGTDTRITFTDVVELEGKDSTGKIVKLGIPKQINTGEGSNIEYYKELYLMRYIDKYSN